MFFADVVPMSFLPGSTVLPQEKYASQASDPTAIAQKGGEVPSRRHFWTIILNLVQLSKLSYMSKVKL